jgi:hypothetical protein
MSYRSSKQLCDAVSKGDFKTAKNLLEKDELCSGVSACACARTLRNEVTVVRISLKTEDDFSDECMPREKQVLGRLSFEKWSCSGQDRLGMAS